MLKKSICAVFVSLCFSLSASAGAQTATTVNFSTTYQTIRGFGTSTAWQPVMPSALVDGLFGTGSGQVGLTILRSRIDPSSTTGGSNWATELSNGQEAQAANSQVIVFATPWSPPAAWKTNGSTTDGSLITSDYGNFANYLNAFIAYEKAGGVNLYAISVQNEPNYLPDYESCGYTPAQMDAFVAQEGGTINTKLMMPEADSFNTNMSDPTLDDSNAVGHVAIVAGHLYGQAPFYYTNAKNLGKDVWATEHYLTPANGASQPAIGDAISLAEELHQSMAVAQYNAYVYWWTPLLNNNNAPNYYAFALGQFSKYVRPGYVMTGANNNPTSGVYVTSYKGNNNYVIVAINSNSGSSSLDFQISGATLTSMTLYQTNSSGGLIQEGNVSVSSNSFTYSLPGNSITTFVGTGSSSGGGAIDIDAGGAASGSWVADEDYSGGTALTYTNSVSTSLLSGTIPPQTVLQSQRYGSGSSFTYTIPGYTAGSSHTVTLYFVENYVTGSGEREFDVYINGTEVLTNYDVYAAAGGQFKAVEKSFTTTANSSGQIVIEFSPGAVQNPMVSGIAIQ